MERKMFILMVFIILCVFSVKTAGAMMFQSPSGGNGRISSVLNPQDGILRPVQQEGTPDIPDGIEECEGDGNCVAYQVGDGDTLYSISNEYGVTINSIVNLTEEASKEDAYHFPKITSTLIYENYWIVIPVSVNKSSSTGAESTSTTSPETEVQSTATEEDISNSEAEGEQTDTVEETSIPDTSEVDSQEAAGEFIPFDIEDFLDDGFKFPEDGQITIKISGDTGDLENIGDVEIIGYNPDTREVKFIESDMIVNGRLTDVETTLQIDGDVSLWIVFDEVKNRWFRKDIEKLGYKELFEVSGETFVEHGDKVFELSDYIDENAELADPTSEKVTLLFFEEGRYEEACDAVGGYDCEGADLPYYNNVEILHYNPSNREVTFAGNDGVVETIQVPDDIRMAFSFKEKIRANPKFWPWPGFLPKDKVVTLFYYEDWKKYK